MFREPRENAALPPDERRLPSAGRPPTPPRLSATSRANSSPYFPQSHPAPMTVMETPVLGRQTTSRPISAKKAGPKQTKTILNFFGKAEKAEIEGTVKRAETGLFFEDAVRRDLHNHLSSTQSSSNEKFVRVDNASEVDLEDLRFNEDNTAIKRRRVNDDGERIYSIVRTPSPELANLPKVATKQETVVQSLEPRQAGRKPQRRVGGFVDESSDDEDVETQENGQVVDDSDGNAAKSDNLDEEINGERPLATARSNPDIWDASGYSLEPTMSVDPPAPGYDMHERSSGDTPIPLLSREQTSLFNPGDFGDEDFEDEFVEEGEEYIERRWMEEQREMETMMDDDSRSESGAESIRTPQDFIEAPLDDTPETNDGLPVCPICNGSMKGMSENDASSHVNACLDGTASQLPTLMQSPSNTTPSLAKCSSPNSAPISTSITSSKRFQRAAIARPGQANPFSFAKEGKSGGSAFTRLMSGHAEDAAWAEAATNEVHSRGKPAYQRTCPFYKIMPGLFICVDAFRYGKVEGQNAYFLSHFHSDHYIGLTSSWSHGPIYASKVTCNLMQQQLRVDSKWVRPLDFEKKVEVPNTQGVFVTMLPANHCPGSSLFLFEKVTGKNKDGSPRMTRILHCGDFRACPAHVNHPLLRPEVVDAITGQTRQQSIDTCYLDTTYLTPKYSFPSQYDVIDACAQMCVSLSKEIVDNDDSWEQIKKEKTGSTMTKFLEQGEKLVPKAEEDEEVDTKPKLRGRLLVVIGTYSIGKERICLGIAKALNSKIYAPPSKMRICRALEDPELNARLTSDPLEAQVHMQMLMEIRAETLLDYCQTHKGHFSRVVGFRPTGWSYRPPTSRFTENPAVNTVLYSDAWKSRFTMRDLAPQRGSTKESNCFGVPYSEHSSFRELTMFCCALRINRVVPTVNVGSARSREKMKGWIEKWDAEKRKNGLFKIEATAEGWGSGDGKLRYGL